MGYDIAHEAKWLQEFYLSIYLKGYDEYFILTLIDFNTIDEHGIYQDLLREFANHGHKVFAISPVERRNNQATIVLKTDKATIIKLRIGNTQKRTLLKKGYLQLVSSRSSLLASRVLF